MTFSQMFSTRKQKKTQLDGQLKEYGYSAVQGVQVILRTILLSRQLHLLYGGRVSILGGESKRGEVAMLQRGDDRVGDGVQCACRSFCSLGG